VRKKMPITAWTFIIGGLALMGIFPFAGSGAKTQSSAALNQDSPQFCPWLFGHAGCAAFLTALYTSRQIFLSFFGEPRDEHLTLMRTNRAGHVDTLAILASLPRSSALEYSRREYLL